MNIESESGGGYDGGVIIIVKAGGYTVVYRM